MYRSLIFIIISISCINIQPIDCIGADRVIVVPLGGSAKGNAERGDVLKGKTFSTAAEQGLSGTRPPAPVEKTGLVSCYQSEPHCDGFTQKGEPWPTPRFNNGIIFIGTGRIDNLTGLIWQDPLTTETKTFAQAIAYCESLTTGFGQSINDWRLPNVKELQSLIDFGSAFPALPDNYPFTNVINAPYWASTVRVDNPGEAYTIDTAFGETIAYDKSITRWVWCVRGAY